MEQKNPDAYHELDSITLQKITVTLGLLLYHNDCMERIIDKRCLLSKKQKCSQLKKSTIFRKVLL